MATLFPEVLVPVGRRVISAHDCLSDAIMPDPASVRCSRGDKASAVPGIAETMLDCIQHRSQMLRRNAFD
jgi:hypothetical protein